ncbi:MAG: low specificity L-threonine aldolase [Sneathiella sp.]|nr:low specificity L-threonine aldolase [Sneathiella sp.]
MPNKNLKNFASDNAAPVHPALMEALVAENNGPAMGYGNDPTTMDMERRLQDLFGCDLKAFPVATGTAANVLSLAVLTPPYGTIYCHKSSHIEGDECGAPEFYTGGAKLTLLDGDDGKLDPVILDQALSLTDPTNVHHVPPTAISMTQVTEAGTVYSPDEVRAIGDIAQKYQLGLHMDGARFANAVASLGCAPADITWKGGVDILSFGATKNGAMAVEAVVFFNQEKAKEFEFRRKRGAHLFSKSRYLSAQLKRYVENGLWLEMAETANKMACRLAEGISKLPDDKARLHFPVKANMLFATLTETAIERLEQAGFLFYVMGPRHKAEVRLVTSWNTAVTEVDEMLEILGSNN